jgi:hypothetical protein
MCQFLVGSTLRTFFGARLNSDEYVSLAMSGWIVLLSLASLFWFLIGTVLGGQFSARAVLIFMIFLSFTISFFRIRKEVTANSKAVILFLFLLFGILIILRLAFVSKTMLPLYFDSARHYLFIKNLLGGLEPLNAAAPFQLPTAYYYHLGFHFLAGFLTISLNAEITDTMLILGQMILAGLPLSIFFIIKHETKSNGAGFFTVLISALGWYMPAYVVNWGKYPALTSLASIQFVLSLAYLLFHGGNTLSSQKRWGALGILVLSIVISGFMHTRSIFIFGIAFLAWTAATWRQNLPRVAQALVFWMTIVAILLAVLFIQRQEVFGLLFDPYGSKGILITSSVLLLALAAEKSYPRLAFSCVLVILLLLLSIFFVLPKILPTYTNLTMLDRPFVEMILFLPLSMLGGLGVAGLEQTLRQAKARLGSADFSWGKYVSILPISLILINAFSQYDLYPADCCSIVSPDDLTAIAWINKKMPANARILIASTEMKVLATDSFQGFMSTDAGAWILPLTGRTTVPFLYDSDFGQRDVLSILCKRRIRYIYVGGLDPTFDDAIIRMHPDWYKVLLSMPKVQIYRIIGCKQILG